MDNHKLIVLNQKEESISIQRVKFTLSSPYGVYEFLVFSQSKGATSLIIWIYSEEDPDQLA